MSILSIVTEFKSVKEGSERLKKEIKKLDGMKKELEKFTNYKKYLSPEQARHIDKLKKVQKTAFKNIQSAQRQLDRQIAKRTKSLEKYKKDFEKVSLQQKAKMTHMAETLITDIMGRKSAMKKKPTKKKTVKKSTTKKKTAKKSSASSQTSRR